MPEDIFESLDYEGRPVRLSEDCWERHIVVRHPEVGAYRTLIQQVIDSPNIVTRDQAGVYHFSRFGAVSEGRFRTLYLEVVVKYERH